MAGLGMGVVSLQTILIASLISLVVCGTIPETQNLPKEEGVVAEVSKNLVVPPVMAPQFLTNDLARTKRYIGWGRRPGLRYSKASSAFDWDNTFNKIYNKYEKRGNSAPESPISSFRELRMKQKVPNIQLLLPHLFPQTPQKKDQGSDFGVVDEDDVDALMLLLEEYAKQRNNEQ